MMIKKYKAQLLLTSAAFIWGSSFVIVKESVTSIDPGILIAIRFFLASIAVYIMFYPKLKKITLPEIWRGVVIGIFLFSAYMVQTIGIQTTTSSKNAFLTATYVAILPFIYWAYYRKKPDRFNFSAAFLCLLGVGLISLNGSFGIGMGDSFSLMAGLFFACHILSIKIFSPAINPYKMTLISFVTTSVLALGYGLVYENWPTADSFDLTTILSIMYLAVFCSALALLFQNIGLEMVDSMTGSVLLSLESVFSVVFSILYGEILTPKMFIGFAMIFLAVIISETKLRFLKTRKGVL